MPSAKTLIQSILLFVAIVGSYALYQNWSYNNNLKDQPIVRTDHSGTHIMPDGTVMMGNGTVLPDAIVLPDGNVELRDGNIITPAFDLRETEEEMSNAMEDMMMEMPDEPTEEMGQPATMVKENTDGTHIMPNGDVMKGDGTVLPDTTILPDGSIELNDGSIIVPTFDLRQTEEAEEESTEVIIDIVGDNFSYDVTEIRVNQGDTVTINFESSEGFHDWVIDEFDIATSRVDEGEKTSVTFVADKVGTFEYYCSVGNHRAQGQVGTIIVE